MIRGLLLPCLFAGAALAGAAASPALGDATVSANWSGYAVHGTDTHFRTVSGRWRIPTPDCAATPDTASAMWVGIGGYDGASDGLEQIGTELDCSAAGRPEYSAWSEILPAVSRTLSLAVHSGDLMQATVTVVGDRVTLALADLTTHRTASRTTTAATTDTTSAEWILEAPSECPDSGSCTTLPLADFRTATFSSARVVTSKGASGAIVGPRWQTTEIALSPGHRRFVRLASAGGAAAPSALTAGGSAFTIAYEQGAGPPQRTDRAGPLRHPRHLPDAGRGVHRLPRD